MANDRGATIHSVPAQRHQPSRPQEKTSQEQGTISSIGYLCFANAYRTDVRMQSDMEVSQRPHHAVFAFMVARTINRFRPQLRSPSLNVSNDFV